LFVCQLEGLRKNCWTDFHGIWWQGGTWARKEAVWFWW